MKTRITQELKRSVLKQLHNNNDFFIMRNGKKVTFRTLREAKESQKNGEDVYKLHIGFNSRVYKQKVN